MSKKTKNLKLNLEQIGLDNTTSKLNESVFKVENLNYWIKLGLEQPDSKPLFGSIWHEHEVAILFANSGKGKSILTYQIFDGISKGMDVLGLETSRAKVLYFDFELSSCSLKTRYTNDERIPFSFNENFLRAEIDYSEIENISIEEGILKDIENTVKLNSPKAICIDNVSFLSSNNERAKDALDLLKGLLKLSRLNKIAILILAYRPKAQGSIPISLDHLAGSKALSNFCDVCFAICDSIKGSDVIYIKELKNRNRRIKYSSDNVVECEIIKDNNFLRFNKIGYSVESDHLYKEMPSIDNRLEKILELKGKGLSNIKIAESLGVTEGTVRNDLKKHNSTS